MKVYKTNGGLGYKQFAYFIRLKSSELLCIDTEETNNSFFEIYTVGEITSEDSLFLEESNYDIKKSPLYNTYLFQTLIREQMEEETKTEEKYTAIAITYDKNSVYVLQLPQTPSDNPLTLEQKVILYLYNKLQSETEI